MGRRILSGARGGSDIGFLNVVSSTLTSSIEDDNITFDPAGTGAVVVDSDLSLNGQSDLRFLDSDSSNFVAFQAPATVSSNVTWTLPATDASVSGYALTSNASGTLSWSQVGTSITDENADATTNYLLFTTTTSGAFSAGRVSATTRILSYVPSTGTLNCTALSAGTITETSSIALKENFNPIDNALEKVLNLKGWMYDRKDGSSKNEIGLIAEEVNEVIPEVVSKDANGNPHSIAYQRLVAYLIESVKELKNELIEIKSRSN